MALCPNCGQELKTAIFGGNLPYNDTVVAFINEYTNSISSGYCEKCGPPLLADARTKAMAEQGGNKTTLNENIHHVPLLSLPAPPLWQFRPLGLVTGQSVTGTGVFSEFASDWSDFFGAQSKSYNKKIAGGEQICATQLRLKCLELGGNAILGVDIDYAEVGGAKGMLMVCMTGTAVLLENADVLDGGVAGAMDQLTATAKSNLAARRYAPIINRSIGYIITKPLLK